VDEAVIVSTARTPIGRAYKGAFNDTHGATLGGHVIAAAVARSGIQPGEIADAILGCANPEGATGMNVARQAALRAGLPVDVPGMTVNRFCASGLEAIAIAAARIRLTGGVYVAGGVESVSLVINDRKNRFRAQDAWLLERCPSIYMSMIDTAEVVARRYGVDRRAQDDYSLESQRRTAAAQQAGRFDQEIVPLPATKISTDRKTGESRPEIVELLQDEGNRPDTTIEGLSGLKAVMGDGGYITAGNASQLSDGASACVMMSARETAERGLKPLGIFRDYVVVGCEPDEMGIGPVLAVPKLLERANLTVADIDIWELNEAFAVQVVYCRDRLGIPMDRLNVDGGAIAIGHPFGMSGARMVGHALIEGHRRGIKYAVVTMCAAGGLGAAALLEVC